LAVRWARHGLGYDIRPKRGLSWEITERREQGAGGESREERQPRGRREANHGGRAGIIIESRKGITTHMAGKI